MINLLRLLLCTILMLISVACTRMPADYGNSAVRPVSVTAGSTGVMELIAGARIGLPQTFVDPGTGLTSTVTVLSEYFSANGRSCRRYTQHMSNAANPVDRLSCKDQRSGWQDIPVSHIVDQ